MTSPVVVGRYLRRKQNSYIMRKITVLFVAVCVTSCSLSIQNKVETTNDANQIPFLGFIPEEHQEVLELIRSDIMWSEILKDSTRITEGVLENPDRNPLGGLSWGSPNFDKYMGEVEEVRPGLVEYIRHHQQAVVNIVKTRRVDDSLPETELFYGQLILKHVLQKNMEMPMLTQLELISQGAEYYAYRFQVLNYRKFDLASYTTYYPWYQVKFIFYEGYLDDYDYF